jgi:Ca2+/Na+ antiporter
MSEAFFERFTEMLFGAVTIFLLFTSSIMVVLAYVFTQNMVFYYAYIGALFFSFFYAFRYAQQFKHFKETLNLYIPSENNRESYLQRKHEPLNIELEDLPLKCALYYRNGVSFDKIARSCNLPEPESAKRKVIEGIDFLLKFYNENNSKKVEP